MDGPRLIAVAAALGLLGALVSAAPAVASLSAATMYEPTTVVAIDLGLSEDAVEELEADPDEYVEGTFSLAETDGTPAGTGPYSAALTVGIRLKGEASFRDLDGKAAFKVKFNEFVKGQSFLDLKKMTLNNMVQDPSMLREALAYELFRAAGVPASRSGYASVRVNGEMFGLFLNLETIDEIALERRFGPFEDPPQHLYEGSFGIDVVPGGAGDFEVDEGDEDDRSDLEALIDAVAADTPARFSERVAATADLGEMTTMWAVERYVGHWDGYSGRETPHNYYLYSDPLGVFQMLPWGTDQTWDRMAPFTGRGGVLFDECLADETCLALYRAALAQVGAVSAGLEPAATAGALATLLAPWQALEEAPRRPFDTGQIEAGVARVVEFAERRPGQLATYLEGPAPPSPPGGEGGGSAPPSAARPALSPRLEVDRSGLGRGLLVTRVAAPGRGSVRQVGTFLTLAGRRRACEVEVRTATRGPTLLTCALSDRARSHLTARWLRVRLRITFRSEDGTRLTATRSVRLPRQAVR